MKNPPPITGLIIAYNEADRIGECLRSMEPVCRQLVVLDSGSTDGTVEVARHAGAEVITAAWRGYTRQRNHALELAHEPWVLFLDADERLSAPLALEITEEFADSPTAAGPEHCDGYDLPYRTRFLGMELRFGAPGWEHHVRLFRRNLRFMERSVHERLAIEASRVTRLKRHVVHDTARNYGHYENKLTRYAELFAEERTAGKSVTLAAARLHAGLYWLKNYWCRAGFLDGGAGYAYHRLHAQYVFAKYMRLWERQTAVPDVRFDAASFSIKEKT